MKPASARTVARYALGVAVLVVAQSTAAPNPINQATLVGAQHAAPQLGNQVPVVAAHVPAYVAAYVGARFSATVPPAKSQSASPLPSQKQKLSNPLNDLLDEAQHAIDKNDFEAAIPPLQKFLTEKPDVAYAHFQLAYAYTALKRVPEARTEYERAIALDPKMSEAYLNLGMLLTGQDPAAAVAPLRKAVELLPAQSRPRILLGIAQERARDFPGAADSFEGAVRLDPRDTEAALHLAKLYLNLKRPADAEKKFRGVLELQPNSTAAALGLAQSLDAQNKPEAADAYRKYLTLQPSDSAARARLVHFLVEQNNNDEALAELDRADAGKPPTSDSLRLRADLQIAQKKYDDAIMTLQHALILTPNDPQLVGGLGRIYMQKHDYADAEKQLKLAIQLDRNNVAYWKDLSSSYYLSGDCLSTLATLDVIAKAEPPVAGSWFIRALCYDKLHQIKPALEAYQKFLTMDEGKNPDQIWQAQQRSAVLKHQLEAKGK
jgi:Flp pilus assembly protein TadD